MKYKFSTLDLMQRNSVKFNDHCIRASIHFTKSPDISSLQKAIDDLVKLVPLLSGKFVISEDRTEAWWEESGPVSHKDILEIVESDACDQEKDPRQEKFISGKIDDGKVPQVFMKLYKYKNGTATLCILLNHMVADAAGFKQMISLLGERYNNADTPLSGLSKYKFLQNRGADLAWRDLSKEELKEMRRCPVYSESADHSMRLPFDADVKNISPHIQMRTVPAEVMDNIVKKAHREGYTVNDIIMAAFSITIKKEINFAETLPMIISCPFDLRRFVKDKQHLGITNLVSIVWCNFGKGISDNISEAIPVVHRKMSEIKKNYPGLQTLYMLDETFNSMPFFEIENYMDRTFSNPLLGMTNVGRIDNEKIVFNGADISNITMNASMKYPPYFQLAFGSYKNKLTVSFAQYCCDCDMPMIEHFLNNVIMEIEKYV